MIDYSEYERLFNEGDDIGHTERFFTDDIAFIASGRAIYGKPDLYKFLAYAHNGVMERMRPQHVVNEGDFIFADIDMDFYATKARPDFPFGAMLPGDSVTVKFFVTYKVEGDKVVELKAMTWAPERGVTKLPKLGGHPSQRAAFLAFLAAVENGDVERSLAYYHHDAVLDLGDAVIEGRAAIADHYGKIFPLVREEFELNSLSNSDEVIDIEGVVHISARNEGSENADRKERISSKISVHFDLQDGLVKRIKIVGLSFQEYRRLLADFA